MTNPGRMAERVALITGGGGEIGGAIARRFAQEGARVAVADLDPAKAQRVTRAITEGGGQARAFAVDTVPAMRRAGGGSIINIASQLGHLGIGLRSPYCTSKAALLHFTRILAMDHAVDRIRANTISPGFILTERSSARSGGKERARIVNGPRHLLNRPGEPEEIAAGAVYLASEEASFVTATDLLIDGGYIAFKGHMGADGRPLV